jgi:hypothetical protein
MPKIQIVTALFAFREQISWGYPPRQVPTDSAALASTVTHLRIKRRDLFTERSQSMTPTHARSRLDEAVEVDIPGDNSCLSNAVG